MHELVLEEDDGGWHHYYVGQKLVSKDQLGDSEAIGVWFRME